MAKSQKGKDTKAISRTFIILWAVMLVIVVSFLLWTSMSDTFNQGQSYEVAPPIELELPSPVPSEEHILQDDKLEVQGDSASLTIIPPGEESQNVQYAATLLTENSEYGPIPKSGVTQQEILTSFAAQPVTDIDNKTKIAFIFSGLGRNHTVLERILEETPSQITMAFLPSADNGLESINLARTAGHEILLSVAMEPTDYPDNDPGPNTLLTGLKTEDNLNRLHSSMAKGTEYVGIMNAQGSLFMSSHKELDPILKDIKNRGLLFVEDISTYRSEADEIAAEINIPYIRSQFVIKETLTPRELHSTLIRAEQLAEKFGMLIIVAHTSPRTLPVLIKWIQKAQEQNYVFIPVSQALKLNNTSPVINNSAPVELAS